MTSVDPFAPAKPVQAKDFHTATLINGEWEEGPSYRKLPHPETGKLTKFTRASRWAGQVEERYQLEQWMKAMVAFGMGQREDLYAMASSLDHPGPHASRPDGWWTPWAEIGDQCMDAAEAKRGAHLGTAVHRFTEQSDAGTLKPGDIPSKWRPHVKKYREMNEALGLTIVDIEKIVLAVDLHTGVCGRLDRRRRCPDGRLVIDDLKTGRNAPLGLDGIAVQLGVYANAGWQFDPQTGVWSRCPEEVRKDVALVSWVPIDHPEDGEIIPVDIAWGWEAAKVVAWLREYRNAAKRTGTTSKRPIRLPLSVLLEGVEETATEQTEEDIRRRILAATKLEELSIIYLEAFPAGLWTDALNTLAFRRKAEIKGTRPILTVL